MTFSVGATSGRRGAGARVEFDRRCLLAILVTAEGRRVTGEGRRARLVPLRAPLLLVAPLAIFQGRKALVDAALRAGGLQQRQRADRHHRDLGEAKQCERGPSGQHEPVRRSDMPLPRPKRG